ncbi:hypothetical protein K0M31_010614 [Melipona bicolor]|uniref:Uncharacterized protein n=2 Tax=Melipona TaxID=28651 RepID=A0AA40KIE5_9HYME|nr:hypothetical protein K0M31_010614 [Melipona bicolor]
MRRASSPPIVQEKQWMDLPNTQYVVVPPSVRISSIKAASADRALSFARRYATDCETTHSQREYYYSRDCFYNLYQISISFYCVCDLHGHQGAIFFARFLLNIVSNISTGLSLITPVRFRDLVDMEIRFTLLAIMLVVGVAMAFPQKDGQIFSNEAIRQAQNTYLIPKDATIQKVQEGIELAAYESIPGDQKINLFEILGAHVPTEVVNNLQAQIDQIGRS